MTSFKNLVPRRIHKERSQPASRIRKHGMLEKKKDYQLRAKDRNQKRLRVKLLREKAAFRNPDEFYFGMVNSVTDAGRVRKTLNEKEQDIIPIANRTRDQRMLAETQDSRYVGLKYATESGRLDALKKHLHFLGAAERAPRKHILFFDDEEEKERVIQERKDQAERAKKASQEQQDGSIRPSRKRILKEQSKAYHELHQRVHRRDKLKTVLHDMDTEKALLSKGRRFKVCSANKETGAPAVFKWQQERRR